MLCKKGEESVLQDPRYLTDLKADGTRVLVDKRGEDILVYSRGFKNYTRRLPEIVKAALDIPVDDFHIDGELVWWKDGKTTFRGSQIRCANTFPTPRMLKTYPVELLVFDIIRLYGEDTTKLRLERRKDLLDKYIVGWANEIIPMAWTIDKKEEMFKEYAARKEEGVIAKNRHSPYLIGKRSAQWKKVKRWDVDLVKVIGYTEGTGWREDLFGALAMAIEQDDGKLKYVGKVGSGFTTEEMVEYSNIIKSHQIGNEPIKLQGVKFFPVNPHVMSLRVKYHNVTKDGILRFPTLSKDDLGRNEIYITDELSSIS